MPWTSYVAEDCYKSPHELEADPEIGGIGVLIGFVGTAYFVVLLVILRFLFSFDPERDPFETQAANELDERNWRPNHVDVVAVTGCQWLRRLRWFRNAQLWEGVLETTVLSLCDIQLLTGLGILLSGYINLYESFVSAYHWYIIVYLAWFSNLTHVACMTILRGHLHRHQTERRWRLGLMIILWAGLLVAIGPTFWFDWMQDHPDVPGNVSNSNARCFYNPSVALKTREWRACQEDARNGTYSALDCINSETWKKQIRVETHESFQSALLSVVLTTFTFLTRLAKMTRSWSFRAKTIIQDRPTQWYLARTATEMRAQRNKPWRGSIMRMKHIGILCRISWGLMLHTYLQILSSELSDVFWLIASIGWGTMRLIDVRTSVRVKEDDWGFGQILPVFLLIGPVITFVVPLLGRMKQTNEPRNKSSEGGVLDERNRTERRSNIDQSGTMSTLPDRPKSPTHDASDHGNSHPRAEMTLDASSNQQDARRRRTANAEMQLRDLFLAHRDGSLDMDTLDTKSLRDHLRDYYTQSRYMRQIMVFTCAQVIPVTAAYLLAFHGINIRRIGRFGTEPDSNALNVLYFTASVIIIQPLSCFYAIFLGFVLERGRGFSQEILAMPIYLWFLLGIDVISVHAFGPPYDVACWVSGFIVASIILVFWR